jgi:HemY protein
MKTGLYVSAALLVGALLAQLLLADPGYVAVSFRGWLVEFSVPVLLGLLVAAYVAVRLLTRLWTARSTLSASRHARVRERARRGLAKGLLELAEGNWGAAEQTLSRSARDSDAPAVHYLVAARAADLLGATSRRDEWITKAHEAAPEERAPAFISQAEYQLKHKQLDAARATLEQLESGGDQNPRGLVLLARVYRQVGEWEKLDALEPKLRRLKSVPQGTIEELMSQVHAERLRAAIASADAAQLEAIWRATPRPLARKPEIVVAYARGAMACGDHKTAEKALRGVIEKDWNEAAVLAFGDLESTQPLDTLEVAEGWLADHREDPSLLLACARLAIRAELYGKARSYLETSIAVRPRVEAYQLLAGLLEQLGEREQALQALKEALVLAVGRRPDLPSLRLRRIVERRRGADRRLNG